MKIRRTLGVMLLVRGVTGLPVAVLLNQLAGRIFSMDYTARVLHEQVFSTPKLAVRLKAVVNEQMKEVSDLKTGMIVAIFSKASLREWQDLLNGLLPETLRDPVLDKILLEVYQWLDNEEVYPDIVIHTGPILHHLDENTEFLFRWAHSVTNPPMLKAEELRALKEQNFGDSIPPLLLANVPDSLYDTFARRGGELMALQLQQADPPSSIDLGQIIRERAPEQAILKARANIRKARLISGWLWVIMLVLLAGGAWLYSSKTGDIWSVAINTCSSTALIMLALGWMVSNYLLANLELTINARITDIPRTIRDQLTELITYYINQSGSVMYTVSFILLGIAAVLYVVRLMYRKSYFSIHLKPKSS